MARTRQFLMSSFRGLSRVVGMALVMTVLAAPAFALLPGTLKTPPTGTSPGSGSGPPGTGPVPGLFSSPGGGVPEIDPNSALGALTLLTGGMLILGGRRRK